MPPRLRTDSDETRILIDEAAKKSAEETKKAILGELNSNPESGSKMSQILKQAHSGNVEQHTGDVVPKDTVERMKEEYQKEKKTLEDEMHESEVLCPTCTKNHIHILKGAGEGKVKCTGDKCGTEYALIPEDADYKCEGCGLPHKLPIEHTEHDNIKEAKDSCPFCNGNKFTRYDWSKLKKNIKKLEDKK